VNDGGLGDDYLSVHLGDGRLCIPFAGSVPDPMRSPKDFFDWGGLRETARKRDGSLVAKCMMPLFPRMQIAAGCAWAERFVKRWKNIQFVNDRVPGRVGTI
jgi:hypothetical protein